jgi:hypothetical protein
MVKTTTEAGGGVEAFVEVHHWFTEISGQGMSERRGAVMLPAQAKRKEDIAPHLGKWKTQVR